MKATSVVDVMQARDTPGAFALGQSGERMEFVCPCGCGKVGAVSIGGTGWAWDGNREAPTLSPSVFFEQGRPGEWHGWLRAGEWVLA